MADYVIVGTGSIARRHSLLLRGHGFQVLHVRRFGTSSSGEIPGARVIVSLEEALSLNPKGVLVATAAPDHIPSARMALERNIDVLIEKPLAISAREAEDIVRVAAASSAIAMVGYCLRFRRGLAGLLRETHAGAVGKALTFRGSVGQYLPEWRPATEYQTSVSAVRALGGGALLELSHEIDLALAALGPAIFVTAAVARQSELKIDVEDTADLLIEHASGARSNLHLDMTDRASQRACRITGSDGTLDWNQESGVLRLFRAGEGWRGLEQEGAEAGTAMYEEQWRHFKGCQDSRQAPRPSIDDGLAVLRVVDAARLSEKEGRRVAL